MTPRTYLFVPATRVDRVPKAFDSGADAVIVDLEDAVAPSAKDAARRSLVDDLADQPVHVRLNADEHLEADLAVLAELPQLRGVMVPKVESAAVVDRVRVALPQIEVLIALVETPRGILRCDSLATLEAVDLLAFGAVDYSAALGVDPSEPLLLVPRSRLALAAAAAGKPPPIDGPFLAMDDDAGLEADCRSAAALGMGAKLCIHPRQVAVAASVFGSPAELGWAEAVLAEAGRRPGEGAFRFEGALVDAPVLARAQRIVDRHST
ncbi:MAG: CoA ester lyase [Acidimicrobiales bacterium]|nr:CoA ester lyase [Acidimicrobiales bacterium]